MGEPASELQNNQENLEEKIDEPVESVHVIQKFEKTEKTEKIETHKEIHKEAHKSHNLPLQTNKNTQSTLHKDFFDDKEDKEENNIFNAKDIPSNIRSNIKNLIEETETEIVRPHDNKNKERDDNHVHQKDSHNIHNINTASNQNKNIKHVGSETQSEKIEKPLHHQGVFQSTVPSQINNISSSLNPQTHKQVQPQKYEDFSVSSSSLSIDHAKPKQNLIPQQENINAPFREIRDPKKQGVNVNNNTTSLGTNLNSKVNEKKNTNNNAQQMSSQMNSFPMMPMMPQNLQGPEYQSTYVPWMNPMGFYYPQQGVPGYDPNNPSVYPMMPMFYLPQGYYQQEDDNQMKKRQNRDNPQYPGSSNVNIFFI